jgi:hypothetical protein
MSIVACTLGLFKSGFIIQLNNLSFSFVRIKIVHIKITLQLRYEFLTVELKKLVTRVRILETPKYWLVFIFQLLSGHHCKKCDFFLWSYNY